MMFTTGNISFVQKSASIVGGGRVSNPRGLCYKLFFCNIHFVAIIAYWLNSGCVHFNSIIFS